jgi:hypothetical protein
MKDSGDTLQIVPVVIDVDDKPNLLEAGMSALQK